LTYTKAALSFKIVSGDAVHQPTWPLLLKIEHMVKLQVFGNNSKTVNNIKNLTWGKNDQHAWRPSWLAVGITGHNSGRGPSKDHSTKAWLQLAQWFLRRRFLCEFPIGSYVKLSSAVAAILVCVLKLMMSFLTYITECFMNFELLPILTDYAN
jgi:hypothetical protein